MNVELIGVVETVHQTPWAINSQHLFLFYKSQFYQKMSEKLHKFRHPADNKLSPGPHYRERSWLP